ACVCDDDEASHEGCDGDDGLLSGVAQAPVGVPEDGVVAAGRHRGHEQGALDLGPAAAGSAIGVGGAALVGVGGDAGQGGGLTAVDAAEFGHETDQGGGGGGADARDGAQDPLGADEFGGGAHQCGDGGVEGLDLGVEAGSQRLQAGPHRLGAGGGQAVGAGGALSHQVGPGEHQGLQAFAVRVGGLPAGEACVAFLGVVGERASIEGVALGQGAERADEGLDLAGVGPVGGASGREQSGQKGVLVTAGGLAHDQAGRVEAGREGGEAVGLVGQGPEAGIAAVEHHDAGLANIAAEEAGGDRRGGGCGVGLDGGLDGESRGGLGCVGGGRHGGYPGMACDCLRA
ncbi:hypothetical protein C1645_746431, partial [Glomus cerebriforme]